MLRLVQPTDPRYVETALARLDLLVVDHAHCEHKAAVTALSFVSKYPDDPFLVVRLSALARDEAAHFARMAELCTRRGLSLGHPDKDAYVQRLLSFVRPSVLEQRVDRLLVCGLIEARSCERLKLLAEGLAALSIDEELAHLYDELWREEAAHHALFVELAERSSKDDISARLQELARRESEIVADLPLRAAIH